MKFLPLQKTLQNGKTVIIRMANRKDAQSLLEAVSRYLIDSEYLLTSIEEFNPTLQDERRWIETLNENRNCLLLVAEHRGKIIGNIDLKGELRKKTRHNALLGIGILKEWRGIGLGRLLMEYAISWAQQSLSLETLWLHVFAGNTHAIHLYQSMGFRELCVQKNFIKKPDGTYEDNIIMCLSVVRENII